MTKSAKKTNSPELNENLDLNKVSYIPEGFHTVTPFFMSDDPDELVSFIEAIGGKEIYSLRNEDKIQHAQYKIGDSMVLLGDAMGQGATPLCLYLYVEDADAIYKKALLAGADPIMEPADQFYGDRNGGVKDKQGNTWWFATHIEDVPEKELEKRAKAFGGKAEQAKKGPDADTDKNLIQKSRV